MYSPIARGLMAAARLTEWAHRRIHGPRFAEGDIVVWRDKHWTLRALCTDGRWYAETGCNDMAYIDERDFIRVVRYGEGE